MTPQIKQRIEQIRRGEVPEGYKKTKVGVVPSEWEITKLSSISSHVTKKNTAGNIQTTFTNSATQGVIRQTDYFDKEISNRENITGYYVVQENDYIYNPRISVSAPCGPINKSHFVDEGVVSPLYTVFKMTNDLQKNQYIEYYLKSPFWHRYMCGVANYGARHDRMNITNDDLFAMPVPLPPLPEQEKIAEILFAQDKLIALKEKLIEEKKRQKKALMQQLLTGKKRLPGFSGELKQVKLGDICSTFSGGTPNRSHSEYYGGDIPWIKSGELNRGDIYDTEETLTNLGLNNSSAKIAPKGTLLIAMYGATAGILAFTHIDAAINQAILALIPTTKVSTCFIKESLDVQIETATHRLTQGGQPNFNASIIESFSISMPCFEEQEAISNIAKTADYEIALLNNDLYQEKQKKKTLMQHLLTGIVRVKT